MFQASLVLDNSPSKTHSALRYAIALALLSSRDCQFNVSARDADYINLTSPLCWLPCRLPFTPDLLCNTVSVDSLNILTTNFSESKALCFCFFFSDDRSDTRSIDSSLRTQLCNGVTRKNIRALMILDESLHFPPTSPIVKHWRIKKVSVLFSRKTSFQTRSENELWDNIEKCTTRRYCTSLQRVRSK